MLACRRNQDKAEPGKWEFPGGKVEVGESETDALVREIREELDTEIAIGDHITTDDTDRGTRIIRLSVYEATLAADAPSRSSDHDELRWIPGAEIRELDWAPADLPVVSRLADAAWQTP